jgi:CBS domain-containing protein
MKIEQIMTRDVVTVTPETPLKDVASLLTKCHISGAPVCTAGGRVLGVVSEADILRREEGIAPGVGGRFRWLFRRLDGELDKVSAHTAGDAMTAPALTVRPGQRVADAARLMVEHRINRLPVVAHGHLVGIVTRADLVRAFQRSDEEIEREIREEVLLGILLVPPEDFEVAVADGAVTIRGDVNSRFDAEILERCLWRVPGVVDVRSELTDRSRAVR